MASRSLQATFAPNNRCFGCGPKNELGLRIESIVEGDVVVCRFTPSSHHLAFDGIVNGGIIGTVLDCHSNWTAAHGIMVRQGVDEPPCTVTADYAVKLKRPTPITAELVVTAKVVEQGTDRALVEATMVANGKVTATCTGNFVAVTEGHPAFHRW
jgi:acyl-coenzyme A thioesterase PaaI-like protein